jgi:hypothetical protein
MIYFEDLIPGRPIRTADGKAVYVEVEPGTTICELKQKLAETDYFASQDLRERRQLRFDGPYPAVWIHIESRWPTPPGPGMTRSSRMDSCIPRPPCYTLICRGECGTLGDYGCPPGIGLLLRLSGNRLKFEASKCTITCKQQLALPRLVSHIFCHKGPPAGPKDIHFLVEGAETQIEEERQRHADYLLALEQRNLSSLSRTADQASSAGDKQAADSQAPALPAQICSVSFSETQRVAGTISFKSDDPSIAEVEGSNILARSAGTTTVTAFFLPSDSECIEFFKSEMRRPTGELMSFSDEDSERTGELEYINIYIY